MNACPDCRRFRLDGAATRCPVCQQMRDEGWFVDGYALNHRHHVDRNGQIHRSHYCAPCWTRTPGSRLKARVRRAKRACARFFGPPSLAAGYLLCAAAAVIGLAALLLACLLILWAVTRGLGDVLAWIA